jgi:hypothetical protein
VKLYFLANLPKTETTSAVMRHEILKVEGQEQPPKARVRAQLASMPEE